MQILVFLAFVLFVLFFLFFLGFFGYDIEEHRPGDYVFWFLVEHTVRNLTLLCF